MSMIYYSKCLQPNSKEDYLGETERRGIERTVDHCGKDKPSHLLKHALISSHSVARGRLEDIRGFIKADHR